MDPLHRKRDTCTLVLFYFSRKDIEFLLEEVNNVKVNGPIILKTRRNANVATPVAITNGSRRIRNEY